MAKPFDATLNALIDLRPGDWADAFGRLAGIPPGPSVVLDTDLATTLQAEKLFRIEGESPSLLHLELEANPRTGIPRDLMRYNTLIDHQHNLPVASVLILLRPKALASDQTECYRRLDVKGELIVEFHYRIEKVWERSVDFWLQCGLGLAPLALLTDEANRKLDEALDRFRSCLRDNRADETVAKSLLGSSYVLCGLRYDKARVAEMYRRLSMLMEDSTTYQGILEEGVAKGMAKGLSQGLSQGLTQGLTQGMNQGLRSTILRIGTKRFGSPADPISRELQRIDDATRLEMLADRILDAGSWDDLLAGG